MVWNDKVPLKEILFILSFILGLILRGLDLAESMKRTSETFDLPEDVIRRILGQKH